MSVYDSVARCCDFDVRNNHLNKDAYIVFQIHMLQVVTLNFFVERFQPPLPVRREDTFMQTDPMVSLIL